MKLMDYVQIEKRNKTVYVWMCGYPVLTISDVSNMIYSEQIIQSGKLLNKSYGKSDRNNMIESFLQKEFYNVLEMNPLIHEVVMGMNYERGRKVKEFITDFEEFKTTKAYTDIRNKIRREDIKLGTVEIFNAEEDVFERRGMIVSKVEVCYRDRPFCSLLVCNIPTRDGGYKKYCILPYMGIILRGDKPLSMIKEIFPLAVYYDNKLKNLFLGESLPSTDDQIISFEFLRRKKLSLNDDIKSILGREILETFEETFEIQIDIQHIRPFGTVDTPHSKVTAYYRDIKICDALGYTSFVHDAIYFGHGHLVEHTFDSIKNEYLPISTRTYLDKKIYNLFKLGSKDFGMAFRDGSSLFTFSELDKLSSKFNVFLKGLSDRLGILEYRDGELRSGDKPWFGTYGSVQVRGYTKSDTALLLVKKVLETEGYLSE